MRIFNSTGEKLYQEWVLRPVQPAYRPDDLRRSRHGKPAKEGTKLVEM